MATIEKTRADTSIEKYSYRDLFNMSADAILIIDGDTFADCNQATVDMLRYETREQVLETHPSALSPEYQPDGQLSFDKANTMIKMAFEKGSHRFEWNHIRADGEVFPVEVLLTAIRHGDSHILHTVWRDITERKQLERDLLQSQKMEAIGKLAGGVAHDFNNLLVPILGNAELLEMDLEPDNPLLEHVHEIRIAGERAADMVRQLLTYSRKQIIEVSTLDLNEEIRTFEPMLARLIGEDILIRLMLTDQPMKVSIDKTQLQQVVMNLATNARDAMPEGGRLTFQIATENIPEGDKRELAPGPYAHLTVTDTGCGIDPGLVDKIFDPFVTSKNLGTGLGLATVHGIICQNHGDIRCTSPKVGTTFTIRLPLSNLPIVSVPRDTALNRHEYNGHETILLVEDEPSVARITERVLTSAGYNVRVADSGMAALSMMENESTPFDLLLTDVIMPGMSGPELATEMARRRPDIKVLFISGYTNESLTSRGVLEAGVELIQKPFVSKDLKQQIRAVLDASLTS